MSISWLRIKAVLIQEYYIMIHSLEAIVDIFFWAIINTIVFGFVNLFLIGDSKSATASFLLIGMLLWEIVRITQYSISVAALWNVWSRNLSNMFITPLTITEYMIAQMFSGVLKGVVVFLMASLVALSLFQFNIFQLGLTNLVLFYINLTIFAWTIGTIVLGLIFRYGTRIQALAWSMIFLFQPLTAAFFPVKVLPGFLQTLAYFLPPTYVFEAARSGFADGHIDFGMMGIAFGLNCIYYLLSLWFFLTMFRISKETAQFARNEG